MVLDLEHFQWDKLYFISFYYTVVVEDEIGNEQ